MPEIHRHLALGSAEGRDAYGRDMRKAWLSGCWLLAVLLVVGAQPAFAFGAATWFTQERLQKLLDSAAVESPKLATYLVFLGLGWFIGRRLTILWSRRQKENEQDLDAARDFHAL